MCWRGDERKDGGECLSNWVIMYSTLNSISCIISRWYFRLPNETCSNKRNRFMSVSVGQWMIDLLWHSINVCLNHSIHLFAQIQISERLRTRKLNSVIYYAFSRSHMWVADFDICIVIHCYNFNSSTAMQRVTHVIVNLLFDFWSTYKHVPAGRPWQRKEVLSIYLMA